MTLLCIGKSGQVARALSERSAAHGVRCICLGRPEVDLTEPETLQVALARTSPSLVINAAAYTHVDRAESDRDTAFAVNAEGPWHLARLCAQFHLPLVHLSTDYVFNDATAKPMNEADPVTGSNVYGASKAAGEAAVREALPAHMILRTSWVYSPFGTNFVKTMLRLAREHGGAKVVDDQIGSPTSAFEIADTILKVAPHLTRSGAIEKFGTYHFAASGAVSWADLAAYTFELYEAKTGCKVDLKRIPSSDYPTPAPRPRNSRLDTRKIAETFGIIPRDWKIGVKETVDRLLEQKASEV